MGRFKEHFKILRKHPIFPVLAFIVLASIIKENYPFSHFSMYSNPKKSVRLAYITDEKGEPLPILYHTGLSTSKVSKTLNRERTPLENTAKKAGRDLDASDVIDEINREAGKYVLEAVRALSMKRRKRELTGPIQLIEMTILVRDGQLVEDRKLMAQLPEVTP
ncbi:hypothetical protein OAK43_02855 [Verrucomicrobiales bacterium]|nr:hypothetical protein [Verrucomicrobiales bacterium]